MSVRSRLVLGLALPFGVSLASAAGAQNAPSPLLAVSQTQGVAEIVQPATIANAPNVTTALTGSTMIVESRGGRAPRASGGGGSAQLRSVTSTNIATLPTQTTFVVSGVSGQSISVTVPPEVNLTRQGGVETAQLTTTSDLSQRGAQRLRGDFRGTGALSFNVGGQVTLASNMAAGTYNGIVAVVAQYN